MQGMKDLLESERGIFSILVLVSATVLAGLRIVKPEDWVAIIKWITLTLVASKTVTGAIETISKNQGPPPPDLPTATAIKT